MHILKRIGMVAFAVGIFAVAGDGRAADVSISIGVEPVCPYGYYEVPPYGCAPDGYYGPEWFNGGVFIGAGPWYHGHERFYGHVDHRYDYRHGYRGPLPGRGEHRGERRREFRGRWRHDPHGREIHRWSR